MLHVHKLTHVANGDDYTIFFQGMLFTSLVLFLIVTMSFTTLMLVLFLIMLLFLIMNLTFSFLVFGNGSCCGCGVCDYDVFHDYLALGPPPHGDALHDHPTLAFLLTHDVLCDCLVLGNVLDCEALHDCLGFGPLLDHNGIMFLVITLVLVSFWML